MKTTYLVTGNPGKLRELQALLPASLNLTAKKLDIHEIQSMDLGEIVRDKLRRAYDQLGQPVIVDDVSAELACLGGLPGPYMRTFEDTLGNKALWELARHYDDRSATIRCTMGYYDGQNMKVVTGSVHGQIVEPRGKNGFGFDFVFMPNGHERTNAEMTLEEKNKISHRALAIKKLVAALESVG